MVLLILALTLTLSLTLVLAFLSSQMPPDTVLSGSVAVVVAMHSVETGKKKNFRLISVPVHRSDLLMANSRPSYSGDS
jgi:hypothetical protein